MYIFITVSLLKMLILFTSLIALCRRSRNRKQTQVRENDVPPSETNECDMIRSEMLKSKEKVVFKPEKKQGLNESPKESPKEGLIQSPKESPKEGFDLRKVESKEEGSTKQYSKKAKKEEGEENKSDKKELLKSKKPKSEKKCVEKEEEFGKEEKPSAEAKKGGEKPSAEAKKGGEKPSGESKEGGEKPSGEAKKEGEAGKAESSEVVKKEGESDKDDDEKAKEIKKKKEENKEGDAAKESPKGSKDKKDDAAKESPKGSTDKKDDAAKESPKGSKDKKDDAAKESPKGSTGGGADGDGVKKKNEDERFLPKVVDFEPRELIYTANGGTEKITIKNNTEERQAIKVKCSDNNLFRVNPVFAFMEPGAEQVIEVHRSSAPPKDDKIVLVYTSAEPNDTDAPPLFKRPIVYANYVVPIKIALNVVRL